MGVLLLLTSPPSTLRVVGGGSAAGPSHSRTSGDVRFHAAVGSIADIKRPRPYAESPAYSYLAEFKTSAKPFTRQRPIVVDPGDRWQLRQVRCIRQHFRKRHSDRKPCEENLIHSAVHSAVDW